jgi:hypothetical protein
VDNGNTDVGNHTPTRKPGRPMVERAALANARPRISTAMAQQCGDSGNQSAPQKLVHLVGCRDTGVRATPWVRPGPAPVNR